MFDVFAQRTEAASTHATRVAHNTGVEAKGIVATIVALTQAELVCAQFVQFIEIKVLRFISKLEESIKTRAGSRCELNRSGKNSGMFRCRG